MLYFIYEVIYLKQFEVPLNNGYKIVASVGFDEDYPNEIRIEVYDSDDTWNQELVRISNYIEDEEGTGHIYDEERFSILVSENNEDAEEFIVNLLHDVEETDDDEYIDYDDEDSDYIKESASTYKSLDYGAQGEDVKVIQRRLQELGYFSGTIGGNYLTKTQAAIKNFQTDYGLQIDGICDEVTYNKLFDNDIKKKTIEKTFDDSSTEPAHGTAKEMDWWKSDIQKIFAKGVVATITDVETGLAWKEQRKGGTNHADVQPCTAADTAALKKAYKGKWSWDRRAIFVTINGVNYAASMNGMPHGNSSIKDNNFDGHHCIHMLSSRTHCSNKVCPKHQAMVKKAAAAVLE